MLETSTKSQYAREGYLAAKKYGKARWFEIVNRCPYGPARPGRDDPRAHEWYRGFWFWHYVIYPWVKACGSSNT